MKAVTRPSHRVTAFIESIVLSRFQGMSRASDEVISYDADDKAYAKIAARAMRKWDKTKAIAPKDLRNTLQTAAVDQGWNEYLIERYVGHAPRTIAKRHYYGDKGQRLIDEFRRQILPRIEDLIAGAQSSPEESILEKGADSTELSERVDSRNMDPVVAEVPFGAIHSEECHVARIISLSELAG